MRFTELRPFGPNRPILRELRAEIGKTAIIYPVSALHSIALGTTNLGLVYYLRDYFDAAPAEVGVVTALFSVAYFIGCFVFRPFTRLLLPRYSLLLSVCVNAVLVTGMLLAGSVAVVGVFNTLFGFGVSLFWPPIMGWLSTGLEGRHLGRALGRFNLSWSIGLIVSPFLAGLLTEHDARYALEFGVGALVTVSLVVIAGSFVLQRVRSDRHREPGVRDESAGPDTSTPLRFPAWIGLVGGYVLMGVFGVVFPIHARANLGLSESAIGLVLLLRAVTTTGAFVLLGAIEIWHYRFFPMVAAQLLLAVGCLVLAATDGIVPYLIVLPFLGALIALTYSESVFHGVSGSPRRASRMAIHESLLVCGVVIGSSGGGYVFQVASIQTMFLIAAAILGCAAIAQTLTFALGSRRSRRPAATPDRPMHRS